MKRLAPPIITGILLAVVTIASAQDQCTTLVREAIDLVADTCIGMGRNEVCHGYFRVEAQPRDASPAFSFALGDIVDVTDVASIRTYPFNPETHEWGIALMNLQANLPDELPGANVSFLLLGDTNVTNRSATGEHPMQTLRLETGITGTECSDAPSNGLLIQTPHGVGRVTLNINEVDISLGSTVFVSAPAGGEMTISTLEGSAYVSLNGVNQTALPGYEVHIALDEDSKPLGFIGAATVFQPAALLSLPLALLERPVEIVTPLTEPVEALAEMATDVVSTTAGTVVDTVNGVVDAVDPVGTVNQAVNTVNQVVDTVNPVGTVNQVVETVDQVVDAVDPVGTVNQVVDTVNQVVDAVDPSGTVNDVLNIAGGLLGGNNGNH
ncbi:MAG: hypothetical protein IT320_10490 [Anaerolineae bacterium]|nr:hypothetical protein [Anaerolineae bacterium]